MIRQMEVVEIGRRRRRPSDLAGRRDAATRIAAIIARDARAVSQHERAHDLVIRRDREEVAKAEKYQPLWPRLYFLYQPRRDLVESSGKLRR